MTASQIIQEIKSLPDDEARCFWQKIREWEDEVDHQLANQSQAEKGENIPWKSLKKDMGIS